MPDTNRHRTLKNFVTYVKYAYCQISDNSKLHSEYDTRNFQSKNGTFLGGSIHPEIECNTTCLGNHSCDRPVTKQPM